MVAFEQIFLTLLGLYLTPFFVIVGLVIIPSVLGIRLGVRKYYLGLLLKVFEFGRQRVEIACKDHGLQSNLQPQQGESLPISQVSLIQKDSPRHFADVFKTKGDGEVEGDKSNSPQEFDLSHVCYLCKKGVEAIIDDDVTKCFSAEELGSWNLLTRTSMRYQYLSIRLTVLWSLGFLFRYFVLLPVRTFTLVVAIGYMIMSASFLGYLPESKFKAGLSRYCLLTVYTLASRAFSASLTFHNLENRAKGGGICVANHTTPVDVIFLSSDNCYAYIGQKHTGFVGFIERLMSRSGSDHIWFDRSEMRDRQKVTNRLKAHVEDATKFPMLIFPEGTCINNTSVMMFKKGSFEIGGVIYPVAMKYDPRFCDPFWNSSQDSFVRYLIKIMTSWSVVCDIWYLPPEHQKDGEDAVTFANRVKAEIASQGGLVDLLWDGQLKRMTVKSSYREKEQEEYSKLLKGD
ncbi:glycerol-3-phosphate acyltransferase 4-like [Apostichopus japonicus]|uniref:glycerol-3-phosphate acyltransferase 4-like n=1 Tax=Stichopus japonicus TaxID=307972 RepID=UPI003AB51F0A